jgi:6-phosphogluconolactonase (cycloisomerase 2 family)
MSNVAMIMGQAAAASTPAVGSWDLSYAYYDPPVDLAWDISTAVYANKSFSVAGQELTPLGLFFKPDGTKMYVLGNTGDDVNEYDLSTAWDVSSASYLQNFSVSAQSIQPRRLFFKPDGTKMYIVSQTADDVLEYDLSTAWDVSSASYLQNFSVSAQDANPEGLFFKPDGTKMYIGGVSGRDVNEYDLSTAWDVSTASYLQNFSVAAQETNPRGLFFKPDGTKMYVTGAVGDDVNEYDLSTPWDVSSASYLQNFSVASQETNPEQIFFKPDGSAFYMVGTGNDTVYQYTLGGFSVAAQEAQPQGLFFKTDGTKMYIIGAAGDEVNEYDLSTAWDVSSASYLQNFSVAAQESVPQAILFKPDGTKMYVLGNTGDAVNEYDLSTAWDISSASYLQNFSVAAQEAQPQGLFFKTDGTKMYVVGASSDNVNEYDLSTAWDISTASYLQNFSVSAQDDFPQGLFFKPDGTKMYIVGSAGDDVNEYNLSTAWDVSSASFLQNFIINPPQSSPHGVFFRDDGTQMFTVGDFTDSVYSYTLGPQT